MRLFWSQAFSAFSAIAAGLGVLATPVLDGNRLPNKASQQVIAKGTYTYGSQPTHEHWVLSRTSRGTYIVEGTQKLNDSGIPDEILNYRVEMDAALHPSLVELHTTMDYPSYTCKLADSTVHCILSFEDSKPPDSGPQDARMAAPFDLMGFHSYGWIFSSIVGRLRPGQSQVVVHLFLPNEDRWPNAVAEVRRETPDSITLAGKTFEAQRFAVRMVMDSSDISAVTVWTSRSGLVLKMQAVGGPAPGGDLPVVELSSYEQTEGFVPELPVAK